MKTKNINEVFVDFTPEYKGVFTDSVLTILDTLSPTDKRIFILYAEYKSLRKVGEILGASHTLISKHVTRIKDKLKNELKK